MTALATCSRAESISARTSFNNPLDVVRPSNFTPVGGPFSAKIKSLEGVKFHALTSVASGSFAILAVVEAFLGLGIVDFRLAGGEKTFLAGLDFQVEAFHSQRRRMDELGITNCVESMTQ